MTLSNNEWEILFGYAIERLRTANFPKHLWSFGGGTALMLRYNHRKSKDIDIFFRDPQLLNAVSPRVNDATEDKIKEYSEHTQFTKVKFEEGEIDFIVSPHLTKCMPVFKDVCGVKVYIDDPVEIVAKKIFFRAEDFKPRDVFDLAVVCHAQKESLLKNIAAFYQQLPVLKTRINELTESGILETHLQRLDIAPGGQKVRGQEAAICNNFILSAIRELERGMPLDSGPEL